MSAASLRIKDIADVINGYPFDARDFSDSGDMPLVRIRDLSTDRFKTFVPMESVPESAIIHNDDVVIGMDGDFNAVLWKRDRAALNQRLCIVRAKENADARFIAYSVPRFLNEINELTYSTTVKHLSSGQVANLRLISRSVEQQRAIADYLDLETAQIDTLIAKQEQLIAALRERRQSRLLALVSTGVDAGRVVVASPVGWATQSRAGWSALNIRHIASMKSGHTPSRSNESYWQDVTLPWFTLADVWQLRDGKRTYVDSTTSMISELGIANSAAELLPAGTVMLSRTASVGFAGIMAVPMATSQDFWNWVCGPRVLPEYLLATFRAMRPHLLSLMIGSTHMTIYRPIAAAIQILLPSLEEQHAIVDAIVAETAKIDALIAKAEQFIALSKERRAALITAAVTGQLEIPGVAA